MLPETVEVTVEGEDVAVEMNVEWDETVDTTVAGEFTFVGTLVLPEGYAATDVVVNAKITVEALTEEEALAEAKESQIDRINGDEEKLAAKNYTINKNAYDAKVTEVTDAINELKTIEEVNEYLLVPAFDEINTDKEHQIARIATEFPAEDYTINKEAYDAKVTEVTDAINALETTEEVVNYPLVPQFEEIETDAETMTTEVSNETELKDALLVDGAIIKLTADIKLSEKLIVSKAITIDGNDKTITENVIDVRAKNVTIKNLTIDDFGDESWGIIVEGNTDSLIEADLLVDNVKIKNGNGGVYINPGNKNVAITNSTFSDLTKAIGIGENSEDITINNNEFKSITNMYVEDFTESFGEDIISNNVFDVDVKTDDNGNVVAKN